jgi:hypothetical protein
MWCFWPIMINYESAVPHAAICSRSALTLTRYPYSGPLMRCVPCRLGVAPPPAKRTFPPYPVRHPSDGHDGHTWPRRRYNPRPQPRRPSQQLRPHCLAYPSPHHPVVDQALTSGDLRGGAMPSSPGLRPVLQNAGPAGHESDQKRSSRFLRRLCMAHWASGASVNTSCSVSSCSLQRLLELGPESDLIVRQLAEIVRRQRIVLEFVLCLRPKSAVISIRDEPKGQLLWLEDHDGHNASARWRR